MTLKQSKEMAQKAFHALEDKKAKDIRILDISTVSVLADYFLIASGTNRNQVQAMVDHIERPIGFCSITAILLFTYLTKKTAFSMIWSASGGMVH